VTALNVADNYCRMLAILDAGTSGFWPSLPVPEQSWKTWSGGVFPHPLTDARLRAAVVDFEHTLYPMYGIDFTATELMRLRNAVFQSCHI